MVLVRVSRVIVATYHENNIYVLPKLLISLYFYQTE